MGIRRLITAESVTSGHPDKMCDVISDAILDAYLTLDSHARVSCEVVAAGELFVITGEITTGVTVDISKVVRDTIREIGYNRTFCLDPDACSILISVNEQSPDIAKGVDMALEMKEGLIGDSLNIGAGDQGIVFGFACNETPEYMPLPISLAHKLAQRLEKVRLDKDIPYIGPDGKTQVTIEYDDGVPLRIDAVIVSIQHMVDVNLRELREDIWHHVIVQTLPENLLDERTKYLLNPTGRFVLGGPVADKGLKGRKIIVDTYGGAAHHGGGAFSGKDATKVDRSAAYAARYVAKNLVAASLATKCEVQIGYAIGVAEPVSIDVNTFGTGKLPDDQLSNLVKQNFDLRPQGIIQMLNLNRPIYKKTAAYGHFGRTDVDLPWEHTDRASLLLDASLSYASK